jgi:RHS repeat-associated protein
LAAAQSSDDRLVGEGNSMMMNEGKRVLAFVLAYAIGLTQAAPLQAQSRNVLPDSDATTTEAPASPASASGGGNNQVVAPSVQTEDPQTLITTTTKVASSGSPSFVGQSVTFTATVTATGGSIPNGETVTFDDGTVVIGTGTTSSGVATFTTSSLVAKTHTIKAVYAGDTQFKTSSGTVKQVVSKYATSTTLISGTNPADDGVPVTFTSTVTSTGPNAPTGKVSVAGVGSGTLSGGVATFKKALTPGTHALTAKYLGDSESAASHSAVLDELIEPALFANPSGPYTGTPGQSITFNGAGSTAPKGQKVTAYAWNFGDSSTGSGATPTHSYSSAGTYTVSLTITDTKGATATGTTTATISSSGAPPTITGFSPPSGVEGTQIGLTGTNFTGSGSTTPVVTLARQNGGTIAAPLSGYTATNIGFVIPSGAATGDITVTVGTQSATSSSALTVTPPSGFTVGVAPSSGSVIQGQSTTFAVSLTSSNGFTGLSSLSVTGLPGGVTASFNPASISVSQSSVMTLSAPISQATGTSSLTVSASATIGGQLVKQSATVSLQVNGISTSFLGRTVVDDPTQTPIAGVLVTFLGVDDKGNKTGCSAQTASDASGNFVLTNLPAACVGPQLIAYNGLTATAPAGKFAGVNLSYTIVANQVVTSPVLIHLPRIDNAEINYITQNANVNQVFTFQTDPRIVVTVYAGTTFTLDDGTMPNPFPLVAVEVPVDRLPDAMPSNGMVMPFIVAFQPANAVASEPVAVDFPNLLNIPPGGAATLMTLDPTHGYMVSYGTGSVSTDGSRIVPDPDPANPGHLYGLVHFDWHGPVGPPPPPAGPGPCPTCCGGSGGSGGGGGGGGDGGGGPEGGDPIDLSSGLQIVRATDITLTGERGPVSINRIFRSMDSNVGPFGVGTNHNYSHLLSTANFIRGTCQCLTLDMPDGNQFLFTESGTNIFTNATVPSLIGAQITIPVSGTYNLRWKDGSVYQFMSIGGALLAYLVSITDRNGNTTTLVRNASQPAQITQITDSVGRSLTLTYDATNRITQITDPLSRTVQYTYNSQGTLATVTNAAGGVTTYAYDTSNNLVKTTDARGVVVMQDTYDSNGRVTQQIQADGGVLNFGYTLLNSLVPTSPVLQTVVTDARGNQTTYRFDPNQNLLDVTDPTGQVRVFNHSLQQNNLVTSITGGGTCPACGTPGNGDLTFTYDANGNLLTRTDSLGGTTSYTYDPVFGKITSVTDALSHVTKYTYDGSGNKLSKTDPDGNTTSYTYNNFGQIVQTTDALGKASTTLYDSFGNVSAATDALGNTIHFTYDGASRLTQTVDSLGRTIAVTYDQLDRRVTRIDPKGKTTSYTYDAVGNMLSLTDETGNKTSFTYDAMNRPMTRTDPRGKTETGTYDFNGNLVKVVDRLGQTDTFTYDPLNHVTGENYQDGSKVTRSYDARGRLLEVVDSAGGTFDYAYDADGHRTSSSTQFGTTQYSYDAASRITSTQVVGQAATFYTYDGARNLLSASQSSASANFTYDARNNITNAGRPNGVSSQYTYDAAADLLSIAHSGGQSVPISLTYGYDPAINRTTFSTSFAQPSAVTNTFDAANRLATSGGTSYTYDDNGALTSSTDSTGTTTYGWDSRHRLTSITAPSGQKTTFVYDFTTNLISQTDAGPTLNLTQNFVLDDLTNVAYIGRSNGDSVSVLGGRTIDQDLAVTHSSGQVEYALADATNSTVATVDATGKVVSSFAYEPFGKTTTTSTYPFQYTGRIPVAAGLYNYRARYYSCNGRFISEDPLGFGGGSTLLYEYAANNPFGHTDPNGTDIVGHIPGMTCEESCKVYTYAAGAVCGIGLGLIFVESGPGAIIAGGLGAAICSGFIDIRCNRNCQDPPQPCGGK